MITNGRELAQAVEQMGRLYQALASLRAEVLPKSRSWYRLMAEGPLGELRQLRAVVDAYLLITPDGVITPTGTSAQTSA